MLKRQVRQQRAAMKRLTNTVMLALDALDEAVATRKDIPHDVSSWLAKFANHLDMANDSARYSNGVDFRTDNKPAAVAALKRKAAR